MEYLQRYDCQITAAAEFRGRSIDGRGLKRGLNI